MSVTATRFEVSDPVLGETIESLSTKTLALEAAQREAKKRGHEIEVYDRMARSVYPNLFTVTPEGVGTDYHFIGYRT